jgi:hypothetical protein
VTTRINTAINKRADQPAYGVVYHEANRAPTFGNFELHNRR